MVQLMKKSDPAEIPEFHEAMKNLVKVLKKEVDEKVKSEAQK